MITISGCLIIENNKLILLHRMGKDHWELPGGIIEPGENPEQTAIREAKEEIGCNVEIIRNLGCFEFVIDNRDFTSYCFLANIVKGRPKLMEKDIFDKLMFIPLEELNNHKIATNVKMAMDKIN